MWDYLNGFNDFQSIYIDLPGHGASELDDSLELSMASIANSVQQLIQEMGLDSYDVVGHSMGGYVALEHVDTDLVDCFCLDHRTLQSLSQRLPVYEYTARQQHNNKKINAKKKQTKANQN